MLTILLTAVLAIAPQSDVARESVDLVELNHFYDECGRLVFDQVIFYDWSDARERYDVRAWRLVKTPDLLPQRDHARGGWVCLWIDGTVTRSVAAPAFRETWTQYDPELLEREVLPKEERRRLRGEP